MLRRSPLLAGAVAYASGLIVSSSLPVPPPRGIAWGLALIFTALPFLSRRRPRVPPARAALLSAFVLAGAAAAPPSPARPADLEAAVRTPRPARVVAVVRGMPEVHGSYVRLRVRATAIDGRRILPAGLRVTVPVGETSAGSALRDLLPEDRIAFTATLRWPRPFHNPGGFDYTAYLWRRGIAALARVKSPLLVERLSAGPAANPRRLLARVRRGLLHRLRASTGDRPGAGLLAALLWGDRTGLAADDRDALVRAGTFHLIAISGMHVGFLAWAMLRGGGAAGLRPGPARALVLVCLPFHAALTGANPPVVRAAWMTAVVIGAGMARRGHAPANALGVAALVSLAARPDDIHDPGLRLSFASVSAILLLATRIGRRLRGPAPLRQGMAVSLAAFLGVAPLLAADFHRVAPVGLLVNLVATPLMATALLAGLAATLLECLAPGTGVAMGGIAGGAATALLWTSDLAAGVSGGNWATPGPAAGTVVAYYALLLAAAGRLPVALRKPCLCLFVLAVAAALAGRPEAPPDGLLRLRVLDVGQGDAVLLRLPDGASMLVDAGGIAGGSFDIGAHVVAPALWEAGVRRLDVVVATHPHRDHVGGLPGVLDRIPAGEVWAAPGPGSAGPGVRRACAARGIRLVRVGRGYHREFGPVRVDVLHPAGNEPAAQVNDRSVILRVRFGQRCVLLPGDAGEAVELRLLEDGIGECDVLKVAHHGSGTGTGSAFLRRLKPRLALIPVGETNPWGHPDAGVIARLESVGARILRTDRHGMMGVTTDGRVLLWETVLAERTR